MSRFRLIVLVALAAAALAAALIGASVVSGRSEPAAQPKAASAARVARLLAGIPQSGPALGAPGAPVTLVEYADLQCPYCGEWARVALPETVQKYVRTGKVRIVFRGLAFVGPDSEVALRTALAAGQQNRLWNVVELLYENQGTENTGWVTDDLLRSIGGSVAGLDGGRMLDERGSDTVDAALAAAAREAQANAIDSTPTFAVGRTGGELQEIQVRSLDAAGIAPALDAALAG